jgi:hypothetical protein
MNDAIALLAISQLISLSGVAYLYMQLQSLRRSMSRARMAAAFRVAPAMLAPDLSPAPAESTSLLRAARQAYTAPAPHPTAAPATAAPQLRFDSAAIAARMTELGVDVPALARRMRRSEAEVQALLSRRTAAR